MLQLNAKAFYRATTVMERMRGVIATWHSDERDADGGVALKYISEAAVIDTFLENAKELQSSLLILGTKITSMAVDRFLRTLQDGEPVFYNQVSDAYREIDSRLSDELSLTHVFVLEADKMRYFDPPKPLFGIDVHAKFLSASFEIDEAGKCLALGRPTAAVFHLMRTTEVGVAATARCLNIPDPVKPSGRNWGAVLKTINDEIGRRNKAGPSGWPTPTDQAFFEEVYASLDGIRNPWRNATMHVENVYTEDEAEHLIAAVKGFMRKLASRMDEAGYPSA